MTVSAHSLAATFLAAVAVIAFAMDTIAQDATLRVSDDFDAPALDTDIWNTLQIGPDRYSIDGSVVRRGRGALAISVEPDDRACDGRCQRNEIRIANDRRLPFGEDAWYGFSFQIRGNFVPGTVTRWVVGQWKEESAGSPFLAQRYSGGVFHITAQDNDCRVLVSRSGSTASRFLETLAARRYQDFAFVTDPADYLCETDIRVEHAEDPILPDPYGAWVDMVYHIRGGRHGDGLVEIWANGRFVARLTGSIGNDAVSGPTQYFKIGIYRDPMPGRATLHFDSFRRGDSRSSVDPSAQ